MAKIIKVASSTSTPSINSQFRTSRNSTTNPFKYQNFEGNTLDISAFADVFESSAVKDTNKIKLIAASVAGNMHKMVTSITEPIIKFVNKMYGGISSAWDYAKSTNISDIAGIKNISSGLKAFGDFINKPIELPGSQLVSGAISGIKSHITSFNENVIDYGNGIRSKWTELISKIHSNSKISADMSVSELEKLLESELSAIGAREAA